MAVLTGPVISGQSISMDNGVAAMTISLNGGIMKELSLQSAEINVLHAYGHFLCFDRWGPSSQEDTDLGIPFHGNASKITWDLIQQVDPEANPAMLEMSCPPCLLRRY